MKRTTCLIVVLALAMVSAATAAASTGADGVLAGSGRTEVNAGQGETAGVSLEAEHYAIDFGVTTDEAQRRLDRIPELTTIIQETVAAESARVAGWSIVHEPDFGGWVYLVGDAEPTTFTVGLLAQNDDLFVDTGAKHTFAELKAAMSDRSNFEAIPDSMRDRIAYREIDVHSNSIVVAIDRDQPPTRTDESALITEGSIETMELRQAASTLETILEQDTNLLFSVTLDSANVPNAINGGELINNGQIKRCTSGFAVVDGTTRGMLTAGHCGNTTRHWRSRTTAWQGNNYIATHQVAVTGDNGDSAWYTTEQDEADNFYVTTTVTRDVTGQQSRASMLGHYVCHFGIKSGFSCGNVVNTSYSPNYDVCDDVCDDIWVKVEGETLRACGGDSGGPWFQDRTAYGIHSGSDKGGDCTAEGTKRAFFNAIDDILSDLDLELATT